MPTDGASATAIRGVFLRRQSGVEPSELPSLLDLLDVKMGRGLTTTAELCPERREPEQHEEQPRPHDDQNEVE